MLDLLLLPSNVCRHPIPDLSRTRSEPRTRSEEAAFASRVRQFFWWALFKKEATGPDSLKHAGCLMSPLLCPFEEYRTRIQGTNKFHKNGEPGNVDDYSSKNCACNGLSCTMRLC